MTRPSGASWRGCRKIRSGSTRGARSGPYIIAGAGWMRQGCRWRDRGERRGRRCHDVQAALHALPEWEPPDPRHDAPAVVIRDRFWKLPRPRAARALPQDGAPERLMFEGEVVHDGLAHAVVRAERP